jgi:DNA-binding XRE family transcriptional regulator
MRVAKGKPKWSHGSFFLLDSARYDSQSESVRVQFRNRDEFEVSCLSLWQDRSGQPLWNRVRVEPETHGALLIPTSDGHTEEIPGDVIRMTTNADYRAYIVGLASHWADQIGKHLAAIRKARGLTQKSVASAAGLGRVSLAKVETGKVEPSFSTVVKLLAAMGARVQDLPDLKAS